MDEAQVRFSILVVAREHSAKLLRLAEKTLDQVAFLVYVLIIPILLLPI